MNDFIEILSRLGLGQYIGKFQEEGFETWETILDITESDLETLGVKLGHRRVLQREIGHARGLSVEQLSSPAGSRTYEGVRSSGSVDSKSDEKGNTGVRGKRKYRRHPKADDNAPERAPSAYVIFSNRIREELKPENLSFTAIAKRVGERWQDLTAEEKEPYELEASSAKERYHAEMAEYKTTKPYREHQQYLAEFKVKHSSISDGKRPKLVQEGSIASSGSIGSQADCQDPLPGNTEMRQRKFDSESSVRPYSSASALSSPGSVTSGAPPSLCGTISSIIPLGNATPISTSPSTPSMRRDSSTGSFSQGMGGLRPSIDTYPERVVPAGIDPSVPRILDHEHIEMPPAQSPSLAAFSDSRATRSQTSPPGNARRSTQIPALLQHNPSDCSSKSSITSTFTTGSNASTASSIRTALTGDDERKVAMSLPPLSTATTINPTGASSFFDSATRHSDHSLPNRSISSCTQQQASNSSFLPRSESTGMKFESFQLPLPYNISFGQHPLPRSEREGKLANICDLQDNLHDRNPLRTLNIGSESSSSITPVNSGSLPEPRHPPHHPNLPTLPSMSREGPQDSTLRPDADPLSILAYAGRVVGRQNRQSS